MENLVFLFFAAWLAGIVSLAYAIYQNFNNFKNAKSMQNLPTSKALSAAAGKCEAQGYAWASMIQLQSPLDSSACVAFKIKVNRIYGDADDGSGILKTEILNTEQLSPFYILDETGMFFVMTSDAIEFEHQSRSTTVRFSWLAGQEQLHFENFMIENYPQLLNEHGLTSLEVKCVTLKHRDAVFARGTFRKTTVDLLTETPPTPKYVEYLNAERDVYYRDKEGNENSVWAFFTSRKKYVPPIVQADYKCYGILTSTPEESLFLSNRLESWMQNEYGKYIYFKTIFQYLLLILLLAPIFWIIVSMKKN